jgi:HlyD family secretion protein
MSAEKYVRRMGGGSRKFAIGAGIVGALALGSWALFGSGGRRVEVLSPRRGEIRESFREPAKTRLENTWTIAAQVSGRIGRIELEPGDRVEAGQALAEFDRVPLQTAVDEALARVERLSAQIALIEDASVEMADLAAGEARVQSSLDRVRAAEAQLESARARVERTQRDLERARELVAVGALAEQALNAEEHAATEAAEGLRQAEAELAALRGVVASDRSSAQMTEKRIGLKALERRQILASREEARAQLEAARHNLELARIVSPIDGVVLERYERGEAPVAQGTPLLLLGNPEEIEVIADVLSEDALRLKIGGEVALEALSGERMLGGRVRRIEPQGFTKLSSLGVEQQRVNVIVELNEPRPELGVGFRLHARFFTGSRPDALIVPRYSVLQAPDQSFYVFVVEGNELRRRTVTPGLKSDLEVEIVGGIEEGALVVAAPDSTMEEGASVRAVEAGGR